MGQKWLKKEQSPRISWTLFFLEPLLPHVQDSIFFSELKFSDYSRTNFPCLLEPGFWTLTKGVKRQPVRHQTRPNSIKCWGWSNLVAMFPFSVFFICKVPFAYECNKTSSIFTEWASTLWNPSFVQCKKNFSQQAFLSTNMCQRCVHTYILFLFQDPSG